MELHSTLRSTWVGEIRKSGIYLGTCMYPQYTMKTYTFCSYLVNINILSHQYNYGIFVSFVNQF